MNERIRLLAEQAGISTTDHGRGPFIDDDVSLGDLEQFAQLIVKECSYLADQAHHKATGGKSAGGYVREHFGVEE